MGIWGYKLYQDDIAQDVRDSYIDMLRRGKTNEEATSQLIAQYQDLDKEDAPVFWFALADTQWTYGRLVQHVKDAALQYLRSRTNHHLWEYASTNEAAKRWEVLSKLETRLLSPQPNPKAIKQYKLYRCHWKVGDVFAYCLDGEAAEGSRFYSQYVFFVKVDERSWHPGHIVPVVYFFRMLADKPVELEVLKDVGYIPQFFIPAVYEKDPDCKRLYRVALISTSARVIPKKLIYLGNLGPVVPVEDEDPTAYVVLWKRFESYTIKNLGNWM